MTAADAEPVEVEVVGLEGTWAVAREVAARLRPGDLVILSGELGAGKTAFTKGLAAALGVEDVVTSPTFTLMRTYATSSCTDLIHADIYRLEHLAEVADLGLAQLLEEDAFAVVEWGERGIDALLPEYLSVTIGAGPGETARRITVAPTGATWTARWADLSAALRRVATDPDAVVLTGAARLDGAS